MPPLSEDKLYPKEQALVDLVAAERLAGRKVLVYATHTGTRDITERMEQFLTTHGFRVAVLKADSVAPDRREAWVEERVKQGIDVLICHPRLVQTGLDLIDFPTLAWFETDYSVYTIPAGVAALLAHRAETSGEGRVHGLPEHPPGRRPEAGGQEAAKLPGGGGRAARGRPRRLRGRRGRPDAGLARQIVSGDETDADGESVEDVFAKARDAEASAEEFLVDDGWKAVEGTGGRRGQRERTTTDFTPSSTPSNWFDNGRRPRNGNGNGQCDEPAEGQQSLFSWAEFLAEEPAQPRGRNGKAKTASQRPCSSGRWKWSRNGKRSRWARGARPQRHGEGPP